MKTSGISALSLLGLIFITLKLTAFIAWSWWWVTAPFWGVPVLLLAFAICLALFAGVALVIGIAADHLSKRKSSKS